LAGVIAIEPLVSPRGSTVVFAVTLRMAGVAPPLGLTCTHEGQLVTVNVVAPPILVSDRFCAEGLLLPWYAVNISPAAGETERTAGKEAMVPLKLWVAVRAGELISEARRVKL
jgi:hypothetical protein